MTVIAVTAPAGGRGVTVTAAALALSWPTSVVLAELDPTGGDLAAWFDVPDTPGLGSAVAAAPDGNWPTIAAHVQPVTERVGLLAAPLASREAAVTVAEATGRLVPVLSALEQVHVIADTGRSDGTLSPVAAQAAVTVVVTVQTAGSTRATAATLERAAHLVDVCGGRAMPTLVAVVGDDPFPVGEIERYVGARTFAIADDALGAAVIAGRPATGRLATRSPLLRSTVPLADALYRHVCSTVAGVS